MDTFEKIRACLAEQLDIDPDEITMDSNILDDFGADSLDLVDLIITDEPVSAQWEAVKAKSHLRIEICREDGGRSGRRPL